jgi:hypothetical protein
LRLNPVVTFNDIEIVAIIPRWVLATPVVSLAAPFAADIGTGS